MKDDGAASRATPANFRLLDADEIMRIYRGLQPSNAALIEETRNRYRRLMDGGMGFQDDEVADATNADLVCAVAARLEFVEAALTIEIGRLRSSLSADTRGTSAPTPSPYEDRYRRDRNVDECKNCPHLRGHHRGECALCVCPAFVDKAKRRKPPAPCEACGGSGLKERP